MGVVEICRIRAQEKKVKFVYHALTELPRGVKADEKRLRQVLLNLIGNAVKFTDKGTVMFKVGVVEEGAIATNQNLTESAKEETYKIRFQVEDTGVGMTPEQISKIFLPFEQVGEASRRSEGTGLGLAISRKLVGMMGGKIQVESQLGKGSIFGFDLDLGIWLDLVSPSKKLAKNIIGYEGKRCHILVVDDSWENRAVVINFLKPVGFEVSDASNGKEGLEKAKTIKPDLIITDIVMPVIDGYEMTQKLRNLSEFNDVKIIVFSTSVSALERQNSWDLGCNDFISKPVQRSELLEKLQIHLGLEWIYEASDEVANDKEKYGVETEKMVWPPSVELLILFEAARIGDFSEIQKEAVRIKQLDKKYVPLATKLLQLSEDFEDGEIMKLLKPYIRPCA